jgi:hypothetical protein
MKKITSRKKDFLACEELKLKRSFSASFLCSNLMAKLYIILLGFLYWQ